MTPAKTTKKTGNSTDSPNQKLVKAVLGGLSQDELILALRTVLERRKGDKKGEVLLLDKDLAVPSAIFADRELSGFQALCKYLKEHAGLKFSEIARLLERDQRTVWTAYQQSRKRKPVRFEDSALAASSATIPLTIFAQRALSILESLVKYLKEDRGLRFTRIAGVIGQDQRVVWTVYNRARKKSDRISSSEP